MLHSSCIITVGGVLAARGQTYAIYCKVGGYVMADQCITHTLYIFPHTVSVLSNAKASSIALSILFPCSTFHLLHVILIIDSLFDDAWMFIASSF